MPEFNSTAVNRPQTIRDLLGFHRFYAGGVRWRLHPQHGVEVEDSGRIAVTQAARARTENWMRSYGRVYGGASSEFGVPVELLVACSLTEASHTNPETCVRQEPGYVSDQQTPHRISAGMCQLLISTARSVMSNPAIDRKWLFSPENSMRACAAYMAKQSAQTLFDPIAVSCAYNAGGLYENKSPKNRWALRQYPIGTSKHADRFAEYFNAAVELERTGILGPAPYASMRQRLALT